MFYIKKISFHWTKFFLEWEISVVSDFSQQLWILLLQTCLNASPSNSRPQHSSLQWAFQSTLRSCMWLPALRRSKDAVFAWAFAVRSGKLFSTDGMLKHKTKMTSDQSLVLWWFHLQPSAFFHIFLSELFLSPALLMWQSVKVMWKWEVPDWYSWSWQALRIEFKV